MNGFDERSLDEDAFGAKGNIVSSFDAFRKSPVALHRYEDSDILIAPPRTRLTMRQPRPRRHTLFRAATPPPGQSPSFSHVYGLRGPK
jgi:hypothetical protein